MRGPRVALCIIIVMCLHSAESDDISTLKLLLEEAKIDPNGKNNDGDTPLHLACESEKFAVVQLLVKDERCNPHEKNSNGDTALHVACRHSKMLEIIIVYTSASSITVCYVHVYNYTMCHIAKNKLEWDVLRLQLRIFVHTNNYFTS